MICAHHVSKVPLEIGHIKTNLGWNTHRQNLNCAVPRVPAVISTSFSTYYLSTRPECSVCFRCGKRVSCETPKEGAPKNTISQALWVDWCFHFDHRWRKRWSECWFWGKLWCQHWSNFVFSNPVFFSSCGLQLLDLWVFPFKHWTVNLSIFFDFDLGKHLSQVSKDLK